MKFVAFNVRADEQPFFDKWAQANGVDVTTLPNELTEATMHQADGADAIIALQTGTYPESVFDMMKANGTKVLSIRNVGTDNLPLAKAKANNIAVTNVPAYSPAAIAEFSVTQLMQLLRRIPVVNEKMRRGDYRWAPDIGQELNEMTVGVIGTGRIGRAAMQIFEGFGAKVIAYDPYPAPDLKEQGIYVASLADLYRQADVITLHIPGTEANHHMLDEAAFAQMKQGVYILNMARGSLIDTKALIAALKSGKVAGAALDTYENETPIFNHDLTGQTISDEVFNELQSFPNVLVTPHIAFYTTHAVKNMVEVACNSAKSVLETGTAPTLVK